jgi:hypothetical protein
VAGNIEVLTHNLKGLVEIEPSLDVYHVRIFPQRDQAGATKLPCALHYVGSNLGNILALAAAEALLIFSRRANATFSVREVARWVAP